MPGTVPAAQLQQIHLGGVPCQDGKQDIYILEHERHKASLLSLCDAHLWHNGSYSAGSPRPILIGKHHQQQLEDLHEALTTAVIDIVHRWWSDKESRFFEQMSLKPEEEQLLKWLETQVVNGNLPEFKARLGSWRPDFLVEDYQPCQGGMLEESFRITEINARFSFNGFMHEAYGQQALDKQLAEIGTNTEGLVSATNADTIIGGLFSLFNPDLPLHLLKGEENGIDIHMFIDAAWRQLGLKPRLISPSELRLLPAPQSKGGYRLCCTIPAQCDEFPASGGFVLTTSDGEAVEEIFQVGLELHQHELAALSLEMLRQVSLRCFNDMRTILLVHDKRMLGIIKQEIPGLVARGVLSPSQSSILDKGIVDTVLPGSPELKTILQASKLSPQLKNEYILKPIRGGKGAGIVFGEDLSAKEWAKALERLRSPSVIPGISCVVQRRVHPRRYEMILKPSGEVVRYPLVGTFHVANGKLLGLGTWRASDGRIVAVSSGGSWICSVIRQ